jgi:ATP-dependent exoDNAse (exonuclease V) alpha subunit
MSTMFFEVKSVSRARGSSAVGKAAYDARERLRDERRHRTFDYRARGGLEHAEILAPNSANPDRSDWTSDRATLWNRAEAAETRKNARVAREYIVALPHELTAEQRLALARQFAHGIADRYGTVVDLAVHRPPPGGDPRNHHAHVLSTTRELTDAGLGCKSAIELSDTARRARGLPRAAEELRILRRYWADLANERLRAANIEARLDPRRLEQQGILRIPQRPLSRAVIAIERQGGHSYVAEWNRREQAALRAQQLERATEPPAARADAAQRPATLEQRQQAAAERWLASRQATVESPNRTQPLQRSQTQEHGHDLGAEL